MQIRFDVYKLTEYLILHEFIDDDLLNIYSSSHLANKKRKERNHRGREKGLVKQAEFSFWEIEREE